MVVVYPLAHVPEEHLHPMASTAAGGVGPNNFTAGFRPLAKTSNFASGKNDGMLWGVPIFWDVPSGDLLRGYWK